ncbi:T9SS type A sorting domain-containing protein [Flavobacteriaceae bacterium]|nr:T9SS type A sorting domain-containing protein [Flavobacteriaceae bacterium]
MKNIIKKSIQNSSLSNQVSLFLGQTTLLGCLMLVSFASAQSPEGTWKLTPSAGAFMVGPNQGTGDWFTSSAGDVTTRDCLFDDEYVFNTDGTFENVLGSDTWLETWQDGVAAEGCGTPIAPHDGSNAATWSYSSFTNTITIVGDGAFLGLAKAHNTGQDGSPVDDTITYIVTSISSTNMTLDINYGNGGQGWWRFLFTKAGSDASLSDLQVDSATLTGFSSGTTSYLYGLVDGTATVPQITAATTTDANAQTVITQATSIPGDATVVVTAQDGTTTETYTVSYYYASPATGPTAPPARDADDVISIFGDTYTNVAIDNYNPYWNQAGYGSANTSYDPGDGSTLLYYPNFNYQGIQLVGGHDASGMEFLHLDIWTPVVPNITFILEVTPVNSGPIENLTKVTHSSGTWSSVDVPMTSFTGSTWNDVIQMKFAGGDGSNAFFVDNIYFWKSPASDCSGTTTTWNGVGWSNGVPDANSYAIISSDYSTGTNGNVTACYLQADADVTIDGATDTTVSEILVAAGNTLTVDGTSSLTVTGDFTNNGTVTLNSTEDDFSSLIVSGAATGDITYNRYVNSYNTNPDGGGWDFVCSPVTMSIADFITANGTAGANVIEILGDDYAFASYDNAAGQWNLYATDTSTGSFTTGQGYAMATNAGDGATVAFTGAMKTADQSIDIINNNGVNGVGRRWNLVSNPFPSYINGNTAAGATNFMDANAAVIDDTFLYVYGWNGSSYTIYNQTTDAFSMAPGQAFWVAAENTTATALNFTAAMRTTTGSGDFVAGPQPLTYNLELILKDESQTATTNFYFKDGLSLDLDPGYDAGAYNQSMALSTRLPQGNQETAFSINAMDVDAMQNTRVPLEIRQNAGQAFTISIADMELPQDIYVYLEDTLNGTLTSLKDQDFELTAQSDLSGVDRFFIVFKSNSVLSSGDTLGLSALNVYKANTDSFVTIAGISPELEKLDVTLYSILGVAVKQTVLNTTTATQRVSTQGLASGLYIVQIRSGNQTTVKKIIVK